MSAAATDAYIALPAALKEYPDIGDYAAIGDCRTLALVSHAGAIEWLCLPNYSSPSIFGAMLDRERGGLFAIHPKEKFETHRRYLGDTTILQTEFHTAHGSLRLTDLMPALEEDRWRLDLNPQHETLRIVECVSGEVEVCAFYQPRPGYGDTPVTLRKRGALGWHWQARAHTAVLHSDVDFVANAARDALRASFTLRAGEKRRFSFCYAHGDICVIPPLGRHADDRLYATRRWWETWAGRCRYDGPYRAHVVRSLITLKLLTYALSGAVIAAPTTSLPEEMGGTRNWDYRYCWLRDTSLVLQCFIDTGYEEEANAFLGWLLHATRLTWPKLQVMYDVYGETNLKERQLPHLRGYRDSRPVRRGNGAHDQLQLDIYGELIFTTRDYVERGGKLNRDEARMLTGLGEEVCRSWRSPDYSIWEVRTEPRHHTYSKMMCWAALHALLKIQQRANIGIATKKMRSVRDTIQTDIETNGFDRELNSYVGYYGSKMPDASLLLMARYEYKNANDPRMIGTYEFIERELWRDGALYRYPTKAGYDGVSGGENPFGACSFWMVDYLARLGRVDTAHRRFDKLIGLANDVGLYGEEFDRRTRAARGNFPQAFTHVGLIAAALSMQQGAQGKRAKEISR